MERILRALGHPERAYPAIHVAGTNGKGSVCAMLSSILTAAGYKVGLYTSPHLVSLTERFRFCEKDILEDELAELIFQVKDLVDNGYELSYFEFTTTIAFIWFKKIGIDIAIMETGLGGRLDATNVITSLVSMITNVSLEHQSYLGATISQIAREKAGIIKKGVRVISGVRDKEAREVIRRTSKEMGSRLLELDRDFSCALSADNTLEYHGRNLHIHSIETNLLGRYQQDNLALALAACNYLMNEGYKIDEEHIKKGAKNVFWPCRLEFLRGTCKAIIDGAHNPAGVTEFKAFLESEIKDRDSVLLWASSDEGGDKDISSMLSLLEPLFEKIIITEPPGPRKPVTIERWKEVISNKKLDFIKDWRNALSVALKKCKNKKLLCVSGSLYLAGNVRKELLSKGFKGYEG